jgi:hypothetical protein
MFSFLTPVFLWAGVAATVPLILHLIQSRRTMRVPFSTIRFLKLAQRRSSRKLKMEHFLLWLLRTLLVLLLVGAFAMPLLRAGGAAGLLGKASRDVAIVLDVSYSMHYITGRETAWDRATDTAVAIIEGLAEQDRVCVFLADEQPAPLIEKLSGDRAAAIGRLEALRPRHGISRLGPALVAANDALKEEGARREREIHIITDGQALPWAGCEQWDAQDLAERATLFVTMLGVPDPENAAPLEVTVDPPVIMADMPVSVDVRLTGTGAQRDTTVTLFVDDREVARRAVSGGGDAQGDVRFTIPPLGPGAHSARVETLADSLPVDDAFHFLVRTRDHLPTLCVGPADATLFLRLALESGSAEGAGIGVLTVTPDAMGAESLADYACLFLCDALPLSGQALDRVEQYVHGGGLLVILPGDRAAIGDYAPWRCLPGLPTEIADVGASERTRLLRWRKPHHPLVRALRQGMGSPVVTVRRRITWNELEPDAEVLVTAGAEEPFLVSRPFGRGHVLFVSVSANRTWSDFPLSPYYLPLAHQAVQFAAGMGRFSHYLWGTDNLPLDDFLPEATADSTLQDPDGAAIPIRSTIVQGKTVLQAEALRMPGVYRLATPSQPVPRPALAINAPRAEADLAVVDPEAVPELLGTGSAIVARNQAELLQRIEEHRVGRTFGEALLWLALVVAVVEVVYANTRVRAAPRLSESLHLNAGGKVRGA